MTGTTRQDRVKSVFGVAAVHALIGYAFVVGLRGGFVRDVDEALHVIEISPDLPLLDEPVPAETRSEAPEGAAAPPNIQAEAAPTVVPEPEIRLEVPPPIDVAPVAGDETDASAGASSLPGPGIGAGGEGTGTGSGRSGDGNGGGGVVVRARHVEGRISDSDYPRAAGDAGAEGTVLAHFDVGAAGRVSGCRVVRSSGNADLDDTTCRLIERRFRYQPARDANGRAVADVTGWKEAWWIGPRRPLLTSGPANRPARNESAPVVRPDR